MRTIARNRSSGTPDHPEPEGRLGAFGNDRSSEAVAQMRREAVMSARNGLSKGDLTSDVHALPAIDNPNQRGHTAIQCRNINPGSIKKFDRHQYKVTGFKVDGSYGKFDLVKGKRSSQIDVRMPVYFPSTFPQTEKDEYINHTSEGWSNKFKIKPKFQSKSLGEASFSDGFKTSAEIAAVDNSDAAYFTADYENTDEQSWVSTGKVNLTKGGFSRSRSSDQCDTLVHETGHMFGLGDEYQVKLNDGIVPDTGIRVMTANGVITVGQTEGDYTINNKQYKVICTDGTYKIGTQVTEVMSEINLGTYESQSQSTDMPQISSGATWQIGGMKYLIRNVVNQKLTQTQINKGKKADVDKKRTQIERTQSYFQPLTHSIPGTLADHYNLTSNVCPSVSESSKSIQDNTKNKQSIMGGGRNIEPRHYAPFIAALIKAAIDTIQHGDSERNVDQFPTRYEDWNAE